VSSSPYERGFSHQNVLKKKVRNRLNPNRLSRQITIKLLGPPLKEMDFLSAARVFGNQKERKK